MFFFWSADASVREFLPPRTRGIPVRTEASSLLSLNSASLLG